MKSGDVVKSSFYPKIFFSALFFAILLLAFYITKPFLISLLTGAVLAYLSYPLYEFVTRKIKNRNAASVIVTTFIVLLFAVPSVMVLGLISKEAYYTYTTLNNQNLGTNFMKVMCKDENWLSCRTIKIFVEFLPQHNLDYYFQASIQKITGFILDSISKIIVSAPLILLKIFVVVFVIFYLLKDGEIILIKVKSILPLKEHHKQNVFEKFHRTISAVFYGNLSMAILQGILGSLGFFILGVSSPILWGFVMMLFALIPYFGTAIIWLPAAMNLIFMGYLQNSNSFFIRGMVLIVYELLVVAGVDNILRSKIIGLKSDVHPILVLIGVLGGLDVFGFVGIILGPAVLALLIIFVDIYIEEKSEFE